MTTDAMVAILAFALQTLVVFAGNSRLFGLLKPGSGWYTNVEMATRYASLVTPAKFAFAIWGIIYTWEIIAMVRIAFAGGLKGTDLSLWVAANAFQGLWAVLFATECLSLSAMALSAIAFSLTWLGYSLRMAAGLQYWLVAAPIWLHAGWTCAASIVALNLVLADSPRFDSAAELAAANVSAFAATLLGLAVLYSSSSDALPGALPLAAALCWALYAIRCELEAPELISNCASYLQIGEIGRSALTLATGGSANVLACGAVVIAASRAVLRVWG